MAHPWHGVSVDSEAPDGFNVVIEISKGSKVKYEIDKETAPGGGPGPVVVRRLYPGDYVYTPDADRRRPAGRAGANARTGPADEHHKGTSIIGNTPMMDEGQRGENIICVHAGDPEYKAYSHVNEFPKHRVKEIKQFFSEYKKLEKEVNVGDVSGPEEAVEYIRHSIEQYKKEFP